MSIDTVSCQKITYNFNEIGFLKDYDLSEQLVIDVRELHQCNGGSGYRVEPGYLIRNKGKCHER